MRCRVLGPILFLSILATPAFAKTGPMAPFRGRLADHAGRPITGPSDLTFRIYDAALGGKLLAGPYGPIRAVPKEGAFSVSYGPVPWEVVEGGPVWLEVSVRGGPLRRIALAPFYYDGLNPDGSLGGGKTLMPLSATASDSETGLEMNQRTALNVQTVLDNGPSPNRLDMVFLGDGYTEADLGKYAAQVDGALTYLFNSEPFKSYRTFFNAYRVDVISNESGVDNDPNPGIDRDTALDMAFWCGGTERIFCIDFADVDAAAAEAPARDATFALANSTKYGGSAYSSLRLAMFSGGNVFAGDVATHEAGHAVGRLADEYDYGDGARWSFGEPNARNVSSLVADSMAATGAKWALWLGDPGHQYSGLVGTYEGASYYQYGLYRPTEHSKMREIGPAFNHPSAEGLILQFYQFVRPIDAGTPDGTELEQNAVPFVDPVDPVGHALAIQWYVDGAAIPGATQGSFDVGAADFSLGDHVLSVTVTDTTWLVRDEPARSTWMTETRRYPVTIGDYRPVVSAPASVSGLEGTLIAFDIGVSDPDGDPIASLTASGSALTAGGTFSEDPSHASGLFQWAPTLAQHGRYDATFTAINGRTGRAVTTIDVIDTDKHPDVTAPAAVNGQEGVPLAFDVSATDPDGDPLSLTAAGSALLAGGTFATDPSQTSGRFEWTPDFDKSGDYTVSFFASNVYSDTATTAIAVAPVDRPPAVQAAAFAEGPEGGELNLEVYAADPDDDPISSLTAAGTAVDAGGVFSPGGSNTTGLFRWTPDFTQSGTYGLIVSASNVLTGTATTQITIRDVNRPPAVTAPEAVSSAEGLLTEFAVSAADPDGEMIEFLEIDPLPVGAEFHTSPTPASPATGTFRWTPDYVQAGSYPVLLSAKSACRATGVSGVLVCDRGTATVVVEIANTDRAPIVTAATAIEVDEGTPIEFVVSAADPDADPILAWEVSPLPAAATLTPGLDGSTAAFRWVPGFDQSGSHALTFTATNALSGSAITSIAVRNIDRSPIVVAPEDVSAEEGTLVEFAVTASDPDLEEIASLEAIGAPLSATFTVGPDRTTGEFRWTPGFDQAGDYAVSFRAANTGSGMAGTQITVRDVNRPPIADAGGPYRGVAGIPLSFDGSGSIDPDGGPLVYRWDFGDGAGSTSVGPLHAYLHSGTYHVVLIVADAGDPPMSAVATTAATIVNMFPARIFLENAHRTIRLGSGKPLWCARCEPIDGNFPVTDLDVSSVEASFEDRSIQSVGTKSGAVGDSDHNGVDEIEVCFAKTDLRTLLTGLREGQTSVSLDLSGELTSGAFASGQVGVKVVSGGPELAASLSPNPIRRDAVLTYLTGAAGPVRVEVFDIRGRRISVLVDDPAVSAGYHDVPIRGSSTGPGLASGIYFYRVETSEGAVTGRFAVMK